MSVAVHRSPRITTIAYAAPGAAIKALTLPLLSYLPPLYAQLPGASLAAVGLLFMVARFWDILIDPAVGFVMDRSRPPGGRRRFWIAVSGLILLATTWPVFSPQGTMDLAGSAALLFVFYVGWTILTISHGAWPAELAPDRATRLRLIGWREWAGVVGMLAVLSAPLLLSAETKPSLAAQVSLMGAFICVLLPLTIIPALVLVPPGKFASGDQPKLSDSITLLRTSRPLRRILGADLLSGTGYAAISATSFFLVSDVLGLSSQFPQIMIAFMVGMLVGVPVMMRLSVARGRVTGFTVAMVGSASASLAFIVVPEGALVPALIVNAILGFFTGGYQLNLNAAMVEQADTDRTNSGHDRVSLHMAVLAMTNKIGYALAVGVVYGGLQLVDYRAGVSAEGFGRFALLVFAIGLPALMFVGAAWQLRGADKAGTATT